jgi:hypothetical protein
MKKLFLSFAAIFLFTSLAFAQMLQPPAPQQVPQPQTPQNPPAAQKPPVAPPAQVETEDMEGDHKLTPDEAKELLRSVDEVLHFVSKATLLPIKHDVKKTIVTREQVEKFVADKFKNDVDRIRFERSELVLKKFGLLPRTFNMHDYLIKLLAEQVAGYYDEKAKTMNLLDWISPAMQKPVMAHELTHALQDQSYDLLKMSKRDDEIEKKSLKDLKLAIEHDEQSTCRSAVMEGQGMIVLLDYELSKSGRSVEDSPQIVDMMQNSMDKGGDGKSPLFDSAPLLLREQLIFPYRQGTSFIKELLVVGGKKLAYTGVLDHMPQNTHEILQPKEYLAGHHIPPLYLPDLSFLKKDYEPYDVGAVGEFDVSILLKVYAEEAVANRLSQDWRGGSYYAAGRRGAKPADTNSSSHVALFYTSKWATDISAQEFAKIYLSALPQRYKGLQHLEADPAKPGLERYSSDDGPIYVQRTGNIVVAVESFDADNAEKLIQAGLKQGQAGSVP